MKWIPIGMLVSAIAFVTCSSEGTPSAFEAPQEPVEEPPGHAPVGGVVNVRDFGARGDGLTDDTDAFEAALAALPQTGGTVFVPPGVYMLSAKHTRPNRALDLADKVGITIRGAGMQSSELRMAPGVYQSETHMLLVRNSSAIVIEELTLDGNRSEVTYHDEHSHLIQIVSSTNVRIQHVAFKNGGGDGVRIFGAPHVGEPWTERVWIEDCRFDDMFRNGISLQRAARFIEIRRNEFDRISDQSISSEPSGSGAPTDILIEGNTIRHTTRNWAIALAGVKPKDVLQRMQFRNNRIENGAAYFLWTDSLTVAQNVIIGDPLHSPLRLHDISAALIEGNDITAIAEQGTGTLQVVNYDNALPASIVITENNLHVAGPLTGIFVRDALGDIEISDNTITGTDGNSGIAINNILERGFTRTGFRVSGNEIRNFSTALSLAARGDGYGDVEISGNTFDHDQHVHHETVGILLDRTGPAESFAHITSNQFGAGILTKLLVRGE